MISKEGLRKLLIVAILASVPLYCFLFPFACGFLSPSQNFYFHNFVRFLIPVMLLGPPVATAIVEYIRRTGPGWRHFAICGALYVAVGAAYIAPPRGAVIWTIGFSLRVRLTKDPERIQHWATEVLARYKNGTLVTKSGSEYEGTGMALLAEGEVPEYIRTLWRERPTVGIMAMTGNGGPTSDIHCVALSWDINGILVGTPDFKPTWKPWKPYYILQIIPGVYAYHGRE